MTVSASPRAEAEHTQHLDDHVSRIIQQEGGVIAVSTLAGVSFSELKAQATEHTVEHAGRPRWRVPFVRG